MIKKQSKQRNVLNTLLLLSALAFNTQSAHANLLTLSCSILNEGHFPQTDFLAGDTAIFDIRAVSLQNGTTFDVTKEYRIDFKVTAKATIRGFKVPFKLNESFGVPIHKTDGTFLAIEERKIKLPSIHGKVALQVSANIADSLGSSTTKVSCEKTLTIK